MQTRRTGISNLIGLAVVSIASLVAWSAQAALITVSTNITTDTTWTNTNEYILDLPIFVNSDAVLTIEPGTIVRGQPRSSAVVGGSTVGSPGALIVTRAGTVNANGSRFSPIIMTTAAVDNNGDNAADDLNGNGFSDAYPGFDPADCPGACSLPGLGIFLDDAPTTAPLTPLDAAGNANVQLWGGLVILGSAPTNLADLSGVGYGEGIIEGLTVPGFPVADATYGGVEAHDSSGVFNYISVRHAGDEIGVGNELNGVSLGGVGDATVFSNIEVYCNFDDGIEFFGGTVNGTNLVVAFAGDDTFDIDQGYNGIIQSAIGIMPFFNERAGTAFGSDSGDRAGEFDGDDFLERGGDVNIRVDESGTVFDDTAWPNSNPSIYNMTLVGSTLDLGAGANWDPTTNGGSTASANRGIFMRHGFIGEMLNSIVVNTGTRAGLELDMDAGESVTGRDVLDNVAGDLIRMVSSNLDDGLAPAVGAAALAISNGDAAVPDQYNNSGTGNVVNDVQTGVGAVSFLGLTQEDVSFDIEGSTTGGKLDASLVTSLIDLRADPASTASTLGDGVTTGLATGKTYRGALPQSGPKWTDGWTAFSMGGMW